MTEIDVGQISEVLGGKADTDLGNVSNMAGTAVIDFVNLIYPVGSIYLSVNEVNPSTFIGGTWEKVSDGRVLQGTGSGQSAGSTIEAGLPNITGQVASTNRADTGETTNGFKNFSGAFYEVSAANAPVCETNRNNWVTNSLGFDASRSSDIYGNSDTVQPSAFLVNIWKRTA